MYMYNTTYNSRPHLESLMSIQMSWITYIHMCTCTSRIHPSVVTNWCFLAYLSRQSCRILKVRIAACISRLHFLPQEIRVEDWPFPLIFVREEISVPIFFSFLSYHSCTAQMAALLSRKDRDEDRLAELGYKQELRRDWSMLHNFGVSFSIIVCMQATSTHNIKKRLLCIQLKLKQNADCFCYTRAW